MAADPSRKELQKFVHEPTPRSRVFDRLVGVLLFGAVAFVAALVFLIASGLLAPADVPLVAPWLEVLVLDGPGALVRRVAIASSALLAGLIAVMLLLMPFRSTAAGPRRLVIAADDLGLVLVDPEGVCAIAAAPVLEIRGVLDAKARVIARGNEPLRLKLTITVSPGAALQEVGDEAKRRAAEAVEHLVGMPVQAVLVSFTVVPEARLQRVLQ